MLYRGLEQAYNRCAAAHEPDHESETDLEADPDPAQAADRRRWNHVPDPIQAPLAVHDFLGCLYSLDLWLEEHNQGTGYKNRRDQHPDGRFILGLRFARDRHAQQGALTAATAFTLKSWQDADGNILRSELHPPQFEWRPLADITEPKGNREASPGYRRLREAYQADLAGRPALPALEAAVRFLRTELHNRGIETEDPN